MKHGSILRELWIKSSIFHTFGATSVVILCYHNTNNFQFVGFFCFKQFFINKIMNGTEDADIKPQGYGFFSGQFHLTVKNEEHAYTNIPISLLLEI